MFLYYKYIILQYTRSCILHVSRQKNCHFHRQTIYTQRLLQPPTFYVMSTLKGTCHRGERIRWTLQERIKKYKKSLYFSFRWVSLVCVVYNERGLSFCTFDFWILWKKKSSHKPIQIVNIFEWKFFVYFLVGGEILFIIFFWFYNIIYIYHKER